MAWTRGQFIGTMWFFLVVTLVLVCIRVYVRVTTFFRPWRELLVIFAWLCALVEAIANTCSWYGGDMHSMITGDPAPPDEYFEYVYKAVLLLTCLDVCHRRLFPRIWWSLIITFGMLFVMEFGVGLIYTFLQCYPDPLGFYWSVTETCGNVNYRMVLWSTNAFTDLIITIIPLILVSRLKSLGRSKKIGISAMFAVGFLNLLAVMMNYIIFLIGTYWKKSAAAKALNGWAGRGFYHFINILVLPTAIIVVCVPQLRVVGRWTFGRNMAISFYRSIGGSYVHDGSDTLAQSVSSKVVNVNMDLEDEENRWSAHEQKLVPKTTVVPRNSSTTSST